MRNYFIAILVSVLSLSAFSTDRKLVCTSEDASYSFPLLTLTEAQDRQNGDAVVLYEIYEDEQKLPSFRYLYLYEYEASPLSAFIFCHGRNCPLDVIEKGGKKDSDNLVYQFGSVVLSIHQQLSQMVFRADYKYSIASATIYDQGKTREVGCFLSR